MGRGTRKDEKLIADVINKCWERVSNNLKSQGYSKEKKDMIALEVVKRTAPKNIDLTTKGKELPTPIYGGQSISIPRHTGDTENIQLEEED